MKSLIDFWKKDIINKLIVIVLLVLMGGAFVFMWLVFNLPQGKSFSEAFGNILPGKQVIPTLGFPPTLAPTASESPYYLPTFTPPPPVPTEPPTLAVDLPTSTLALSPTPLEPVTQTSPLGSVGAECIPKNPPQTGKVVEVLDGNTLKVLIDKLVYVVRYTGVEAPKDKIYRDAATAENKKLVYGKEITLVADVSDKDSRGRLLRYVLQGDTFINLNIIQKGLGSALDVPPDSACAQTFKQAEQAASTSLLGVWSPTATPKSP